ncbi:MAG: transketolase C-terminal domain-containing protein, partial [Lachnospiraceae bacterium]
PSKFHGTGPFDIQSGKAIETATSDTYTDVFGKMMCTLGRENKNLVAITAAMADGTGLSAFKRRYPTRFFDVGIAEEHGVTFAAGLSAAGLKPVFAVYSSFLQRGYDQMIHDVCLSNLPVVFAVDRAGLVGSDGETHQGIFDLSYLSMIPNMTVMAPKNKWELADMLRFAVEGDRPIALRYPRGTAYEGLKEFRAPIQYGKSEVIYEEEDIAILSVGHMMKTADQVRRKLKEIGYNCSLINSRFVKPIDEEMITNLSKEHRLFVTIEENVKNGGYGEKVTNYIKEAKLTADIINVALPDEYIEHGNVEVLRKEVMLDSDSIVKRIVTAYVGR